jgi:hypothetical protein
MQLLATLCNTLPTVSARYFSGLTGKRNEIKCQNSMLDAMGDGVSVSS